LSSQTIHRYVYGLNNPLVYRDITGWYANRDANGILNGLQTALDIAGLIPGLGEVFDLANAGIYLLRGDYLNAGLSGGAAIPFLGWGATATKLGLKAANGGLKLSTRFISSADGIHDLKPTLDRIMSGGSFPHRNDGSIFKNTKSLLPKQNSGYYTEFVHPTPGASGPGPMRIVTGQNGEAWFTPDHYETFIPIK